jgi:hypothetical protein
MAARYNRGSLYVFIQYKHSKDVIDAGLVDKELLDFFDENELAVFILLRNCVTGWIQQNEAPQWK